MHCTIPVRVTNRSPWDVQLDQLRMPSLEPGAGFLALDPSVTGPLGRPRHTPRLVEDSYAFYSPHRTVASHHSADLQVPVTWAEPDCDTAGSGTVGFTNNVLVDVELLGHRHLTHSANQYFADYSATAGSCRSTS